MSEEILINVTPQETRVAFVENGVLQEVYIERSQKKGLVGNIYKGRVVNIESGIQAAFIDFGVGKNGFLHISDLHPRYFSQARGSAYLMRMDQAVNVGEGRSIDMQEVPPQ